MMKFDSTGALKWLTQFGNVTKAPGGNNSAGEMAEGIAVDRSGNVYIGGHTNGSFAEVSAGSTDAFVMKITTDGKIN